MQSVCSLPPVFEPPLGYRFGFRAVMFQGMKSGDEMMMNIRIIGCLDHHDCHLVRPIHFKNNFVFFCFFCLCEIINFLCSFLKQDQVNCADDQSLVSSNRVRRHAENATLTDETLVEVSNISFRVVMPSDFQTVKSFSHATTHSMGDLTVFLTIAFVSLLIVIVLIIIKKQTHRPFFVWDKY